MEHARVSLSLPSSSLSLSLIFWLFLDICMPQEAKKKQERVDAVNLSRREYPTFDLRFRDDVIKTECRSALEKLTGLFDKARRNVYLCLFICLYRIFILK